MPWFRKGKESPPFDMTSVELNGGHIQYFFPSKTVVRSSIYSAGCAIRDQMTRDLRETLTLSGVAAVFTTDLTAVTWVWI